MYTTGRAPFIQYSFPRPLHRDWATAEKHQQLCHAPEPFPINFPPLQVSCTILTSALEGTVLGLHMLHILQLEILEREHVRNRNDGGRKGSWITPSAASGHRKELELKGTAYVELDVFQDAPLHTRG